MEDVFYRFHPGVRELLLNSVTQGDQKRVLREASRLIEQMTGTTFNFRALLAGHGSTAGPSREYPVGEKFAEVAALVGSRLQFDDAGAPVVAEDRGWHAAMRVYVAFASADYELAKKVIRQLRRRKWNGTTEFWSAINLRPNEVAAEAFRSRLDTANVFVPLLSRAYYFDSDWARTEVRIALERQMLILPILLEPINLKGEGHPLAPYLRKSAPLSSTTDPDREIASFSETLIQEFRKRSLANAHQSLVRVRIDNITASGFFVGSNATIVTIGPFQRGKTAEVTLWNGVSFTAGVQVTDPKLQISLLTPLAPLEAPRPLPLAALEDILMSEVTVIPSDGEPLNGVIVSTVETGFLLRPEITLRPGIGGSPVLDVSGRVLGVLRDSMIPSREYLCIGADRILGFMGSLEPVTTSTPPAAPVPAPGPVASDTAPRVDVMPRVLVVGTGTYKLPERVQNAAGIVGASVAVAGGTLITGGWDGVDYLAAEAFSRRIPQGDTDRLLNVMEGKASPKFSGGRTIPVEINEGITESVRNADLVVLIGGAGGTWHAFREALRTQRLVLPLLNTGTDAYHAALLLEIFGQNVPTQLTRMPFSDQVEPPTESNLLTALFERWSSLSGQTLQNDALLWMTDEVLPLAENYLKKLGHEHEVEVQKLARQLQSKKLTQTTRGQLITAFATDPCPSGVALRMLRSKLGLCQRRPQH